MVTGFLIWIACVILSGYGGYLAGKTFNGGTILVLVGLQIVIGWLMSSLRKNKELDNEDIVHLGVFICFFVFSLVMITTVGATTDWDDNFREWLKRLTHR